MNINVQKRNFGLNGRILIVDDDPQSISILEQALTQAGFASPKSTKNPKETVDLCKKLRPDLILLDLNMPNFDGFQVMEDLKELDDDIYPPILVITAYTELEVQLRALNSGAKDFLTKPFNIPEMLCRVKNLLQVRLLYKEIKEQNVILEQKVKERTAKLAEKNQMLQKLQKQLELDNEYLREEIKNELFYNKIIGESPNIQIVNKQVEKIAQSDSPVLIHGETGVGKELIARAIHEQSRRRGRPMVKVNCGAISHDLFESEFFGHLKGAFTGALRDRIGRFQLADGGTLFLDEVSEIPLDLQSKLLRILQEGQFEPVGADKTRTVDVRIIAATNRDLNEAVSCQQFRKDLYYRLNVFPILVPPLRERPEDLELLAKYFFETICKQHPRKVVELTDLGLQKLKSYDWPGNIRELQSVIERAIVISEDGPLQFDFLSQSPSFGTKPGSKKSVLSKDQTNAHNKENILAALEQCKWKVYGPGGAAELLGIHPQTLSYRIKKLGLKKWA